MVWRNVNVIDEEVDRRKVFDACKRGSVDVVGSLNETHLKVCQV